MPPVSPIKRVVILSKEDLAFDNYFGPFPASIVLEGLLLAEAEFD